MSSSSSLLELRLAAAGGGTTRGAGATGADATGVDVTGAGATRAGATGAGTTGAGALSSATMLVDAVAAADEDAGAATGAKATFVSAFTSVPAASTASLNSDHADSSFSAHENSSSVYRILAVCGCSNVHALSSSLWVHPTSPGDSRIH